MRQIDIDFDVWKALTAQLEHEKQTYNDVLRAVLGLDAIQEFLPDTNSPAGPQAIIGDEFSSMNALAPIIGFFSRGLFLPNGTKLRAIYKGNPYYGRIGGGKWIGDFGKVHSSPSMAANAVTGNSVNGLRFWEALRPTNSKWQRLDLIGLK